MATDNRTSNFLAGRDLARADLIREATYEIDALTKLLIDAAEPDWRAGRGIASRVRDLSGALGFLSFPDISPADMDAARMTVTGAEASHG